jgi:hypothetical protein
LLEKANDRPKKVIIKENMKKVLLPFLSVKKSMKAGIIINKPIMVIK